MDQIFSQIAAMLACKSFSTPDDLLEILNMTCRADDGAEAVRKKRRKLQKIACHAARLDETARWKAWGDVAGVKLVGLRSSGTVKQQLFKLFNNIIDFI